jgi:hypothetical protein
MGLLSEKLVERLTDRAHADELAVSCGLAV